MKRATAVGGFALLVALLQLTSEATPEDTQPQTAPGTPVVTVVSNAEINLAWTAATDKVGVTGYIVERCTGVGCSTFAPVGSPITTSFTDTGLTVSTSVSYRIRAADAAGNLSAYSGTASAVTLAPPPMLVQHASKDAGTTTSSSLAFIGNTAGGNWIAVVIRAGKTGQRFTLTDTACNTYRKAVQLNETVDGMTVAIFYAENIVGGPTTVTVRDSIKGGTLRFAVLEYSGVARSNSLESSATGQGTSATLATAASPASAGALVIGGLSWANARAFTAAGRWTLKEQIPAAPETKLAVEDQLMSSAGSVSATGILSGSNAWGAVVAAFRVAAPSADLTLSKRHAGDFAQGQTGASYKLTVSNIGVATSTGLVTVSDILPTGLTPTTLTGPGWSCTVSPPACTRNDALVSGASYPDITLTVNVAATAPASVTNRATVSGGGDLNTSNNTASDITTIAAVVDPAPPSAPASLTGADSSRVLIDPSGGPATGNVAVAGYRVEGCLGATCTASVSLAPTSSTTPPPQSGVHVMTVTNSDNSTSNSATAYVTDYPGTFTHHNDASRSGQNLSEFVLTPSNVNPISFGKLFSYKLDGLAIASPLYVGNVMLPDTSVHNVVYVATEHDSVYAFDADGPTREAIWHTSFISPAVGAGIMTVPSDDTGECCDIAPEIGITGTPVIDPATSTLYVVAKTKEVSGNETTYVQRLHALDIRTGAEKFGGPTIIQATVPGLGQGSDGANVAFDALHENQRPALLLNRGVVYIAFGSHGDVQPYHGWVLGYNAATLQQTMAFNVSPNADGGGIWQANGGPAADAAGNIYFITGNGAFDANAGGADYGDSFVKISPNGKVLDYFTPHDQANISANDFDLGAAGPLLLPDQPGAHAHVIVSAGKNNTVYLVDRENMGGYNINDDKQIVQSLVDIFPYGTPEPGDYSGAVYFNGHVYFGPIADNIQAFRLSGGLLSTSATSRSLEVYAYPGATMAISASGSAHGILWAVQRNGDCAIPSACDTASPGILRAYDASNLAIQLYSSDQAPGGRDTLDYAAKFSVPLVANGKVFVGSVGKLTAYGLLPDRGSSPPIH